MIVLSAVLACAFILGGVLLSWSPGKVQPYVDQDGSVLADSIAEKVFVTIGGVKQGMIIRGKNINNPVLLFLHGGPGMPEYFLADQYPTGLEDSFTVCYWEQRDAGLSYSPDMPAQSITTEQLVSDTVEVTNYLRQRFGQDKIYLMAHSWGSYIGIQAAAKAPDLYCAYIGIGQISQMAESERLAYPYMLDQYTAAGNARMVQRLREYPVLESDAAVRAFFTSGLRDEAMHGIGVGTMHDMKSVVTGIFLPVMRCRAYTLGEKMNIWRAKAFLRSKTALLDELFSADLTFQVPKLEIPTYFFSGKYDYAVNHDLSKAYLMGLEAPVKGFYTFGQSAHSPLFEEPEKFLQIMQRDVLGGTNALADRE